jgi:hypothetical protein
MDRRSYGVQIWHFPRSEIPADIKQNRPDPDTWGKPLARFHGLCGFDQEFREHAVIEIDGVLTN